MLKIKSTLLTVIILSCLTTQAQAGITTSVLMNPLVAVQAGVQEVSATVSKWISKYQKTANKNYGQPGIVVRERVTSDNSPLLTSDDVAFYTDKTFTQMFLTELKGNDEKKPNLSKMHQIVKSTYLVDYKAQNSLNERDKIDLDSDAIVKIDPLEDAKFPNTQEFIQHKRYLSLHHGLAISEKILALAEKQKEELESMSSNIKSRTEIKSLENGLSILDKKIATLLNELLVVESSILEINSTLMMQDKQRSIIEEK